MDNNLRQMFNKHDSKVANRASDMDAMLKSTVVKQQMQFLVSVINDTATNSLDDSSWTFKFGVNAKMGNMYFLIAQGDNTVWINGNSFESLLQGLWDRLKKE